MSTKETDFDTIIGRVIRRSQVIEKLLRSHYKATARGLYKAIHELADTLPAVLIRTIRVVAKVRNAAAHPDGFKPAIVPPDFDRLCNEIEQLIPYFADQQQARSAQPPKKPKSLAPKPRTTATDSKPPNKGMAADFLANRGQPWTPEEDQKLTDAFDAHTPILELAKAHQRGVGGIQNRLTKLGKLAADHCATCPPESQ